MASEYIRRPGSARAARFKGDPASALEVASLLAYRQTRVVVTIEGTTAEVGVDAYLFDDEYVPVGHWIVVGESGEIQIMDDKSFKDTFDLAGAST